MSQKSYKALAASLVILTLFEAVVIILFFNEYCLDTVSDQIGNILKTAGNTDGSLVFEMNMENAVPGNQVQENLQVSLDGNLFQMYTADLSEDGEVLNTGIVESSDGMFRMYLEYGPNEPNNGCEPFYDISDFSPESYVEGMSAGCPEEDLGEIVVVNQDGTRQMKYAYRISEYVSYVEDGAGFLELHACMDLCNGSHIAFRALSQVSYEDYKNGMAKFCFNKDLCEVVFKGCQPVERWVF